MSRLRIVPGDPVEVIDGSLAGSTGVVKGVYPEGQVAVQLQGARPGYWAWFLENELRPVVKA